MAVRLNGAETLVIILMTTLGIQATRWLPFLLFPEKKDQYKGPRLQ